MEKIRDAFHEQIIYSDNLPGIVRSVGTFLPSRLPPPPPPAVCAGGGPPDCWTTEPFTVVGSLLFSISRYRTYTTKEKKKSVTKSESWS